MTDLTPSLAGQRMQDRRQFLQSAGSGLGAIALAALLGREGKLLAADPIRPVWSPDKPHAPRLPLFEPAARQILVIFCSGAMSHIDTFDYKPELIRLHDTPLPDGDKLVTFQGQQGNLIRPL
ncbi:MAG TPA: DUF1501 domain-containing protein, partial [Planctomycetaceae bacterium]|nr:DUF1501 domain-containing protein [Planctomycetaceae bacterium]